MSKLTETHVNQIKDILVDKLGCTKEEIQNETDLRDLGMDSLDAVEIVMEIEKEYNIIIPDESCEKVRTFQSLIMVTEEHL